MKRVLGAIYMIQGFSGIEYLNQYEYKLFDYNGSRLNDIIWDYEKDPIHFNDEMYDKTVEDVERIYMDYPQIPLPLKFIRRYR